MVKNNIVRYVSGGVVENILFGRLGFKSCIGTFIFVAFECKKLYNIEICIFYEFNGLNS
jgi:hypothetical protein